MGDLIEGDDGLPAEEVGVWTHLKHEKLRRYLDISSATRRKFLQGQSRSATFIDLFCGPGRARIRDTNEWIDGSAVTAWKVSLEGGEPFSDVYVADLDAERLAATVERLRRLDAPVRALPGGAVEAAEALLRVINRFGLHFAFLDPFSLGALDFRILQSLARIRRVDMLIHVSAMDLQRNLEANLASDFASFDIFAPDWRLHVDTRRSQIDTRHQIVDYWRSMVSQLGKAPSSRMELITGKSNQPLYWLLLVAENDLAHKFWSVANKKNQGDLF